MALGSELRKAMCAGSLMWERSSGRKISDSGRLAATSATRRAETKREFMLAFVYQQNVPERRKLLRFFLKSQNLELPVK